MNGKARLQRRRSGQFELGAVPQSSEDEKSTVSRQKRARDSVHDSVLACFIHSKAVLIRNRWSVVFIIYPGSHDAEEAGDIKLA
ncbi:hypothetical protein AOLI_G00008570 [Acnodon oligacanthus]